MAKKKKGLRSYFLERGLASPMADEKDGRPLAACGAVGKPSPTCLGTTSRDTSRNMKRWPQVFHRHLGNAEHETGQTPAGGSGTLPQQVQLTLGAVPVFRGAQQEAETLCLPSNRKQREDEQTPRNGFRSWGSCRGQRRVRRASAWFHCSDFRTRGMFYRIQREALSRRENKSDPLTKIKSKRRQMNLTDCTMLCCQNPREERL